MEAADKQHEATSRKVVGATSSDGFSSLRLLIDNCRNTNAAFNVGCFDPKIATEQYM